MGLDMYLKGRTFNWGFNKKLPMKDGFEVEGVTLKLGYWRKHPDLHGYIVREFANGIDECQEINLSADNIRKIISAIRKKELPETSGFFFGKSTPDRDQESITILERAWKWLESETAPAPREPKPLGDSGLTALEIRTEDFAQAEESREVIYQASW